jgi:hypothetical protein
VISCARKVPAFIMTVFVKVKYIFVELFGLFNYSWFR